MARTITVDPQKLESAAGAIDNHAAEYEKNYRQLFSEVEGMASGWQGVDNLAFTNRIKGFEEDFTTMATLMKQYSEFLKVSAKTYRETQEAITNQAKNLTN